MVAIDWGETRVADPGRPLTDGGTKTSIDSDSVLLQRTGSPLARFLGNIRGETSHIELSTRLATLDVELTVLESRLDQLADVESEARTAQLLDQLIRAHASVHGAKKLVSEARILLKHGQVEEAWGRYYSARRMSLFAIETAGDGDTITSMARTVYEDAIDLLASNHRRTVVALLTENSKLKTPPSAEELAESMRVLHHQYERLMLRRRYLQSQFNQLLMQGTVSLVLLLLIAFAAELELNSLLVRPLTTTDLTSIGFALYVVLVGILGAALFGMRTLRMLPLSTQTSNQSTGLFVTGARVFIGATSALILVFVLFTGLLPVQDAVTAPLALAIAFAGGYSERLAPLAVDTVSQAVSLRREEGDWRVVEPPDD